MKHVTQVAAALALIVVSDALCGAARGVAQTPSDAAQDLSHAVVTADGAHYRGVLVEYVPGSHVVLRTGSGDRRFEYRDVVFAGPAERAPAPGALTPPPPAPPEPTSTPTASAPPEPTPTAGPVAIEGSVPVSVRTDGEAYTLRRMTSASFHGTPQPLYGSTTIVSGAWSYTYESVCAAPCETTLMPGAQVFMFVGPDGTEYLRRRAVRVTGPGTLDLSIRDRRRIRATMWALAIGGTLIGAAGFLVSMRDSLGVDPPDNPRIYPGGMVVGCLFLLGGVGGISVLAAGGGRDSARVVFTPH